MQSENDQNKNCLGGVQRIQFQNIFYFTIRKLEGAIGSSIRPQLRTSAPASPRNVVLTPHPLGHDHVVVAVGAREIRAAETRRVNPPTGSR